MARAKSLIGKTPFRTGDRVTRRGYGWNGVIVKMDVQGATPDKDYARKAWATVQWDGLANPMMCGVAELQLEAMTSATE